MVADNALAESGVGIPTLRACALHTWLPRQQPPNVRPAQARDYRQHLAAYVLDAPIGDGRCALGDMRLDVIQRRHVQTLRDRLGELQLRVKTQRNIIDGSLRALLCDAWQIDGYLSSDPCAGQRRPRLDAPPPDPFSADERDRVLADFRARYPHFYAFPVILFSPACGRAKRLRCGGVTSDPTRETITVSRSRYLNADGMTKTRGSHRTIKLLPHVAELLQQRMPPHADPGQFVFTNLEGGPIDLGEWARYYWQRALRACGVRLRKLYATRHSCRRRWSQRESKP